MQYLVLMYNIEYKYLIMYMVLTTSTLVSQQLFGAIRDPEPQKRWDGP